MIVEVLTEKKDEKLGEKRWYHRKRQGPYMHIRVTYKRELI